MDLLSLILNMLKVKLMKGQVVMLKDKTSEQGSCTGPCKNHMYAWSSKILPAAWNVGFKSVSAARNDLIEIVFAGRNANHQH